jgi:hypothetical protein
MPLLASLLALLLFGLCRDAHAQCAWSTEEPCPAEKFDASRTLNGHTFVPFRLQPWTFVTTRVGSRTGMGITNLTSIPVLDAGVVDEDAKLVSFAQSFDVDIALARFIALSTGFTVAHAAGINESGAFNLGVNYAYGASLGVILRLAQGRHWYLGMRGDFSGSRAEAVLPVALTQSATVTDSVVSFDLGSLTQGGSFQRGTAELGFYLSPRRWLGLQANAGFDSLRSSVGERDSRFQTATGGLGASLRPRRVPMAFLFGAETRVRVGDDDDPVFFPTISNRGSFIWQVEFGVFYSHPKYVDVGLQSWFQTDDDDKRTQFQIMLNHVW